MGRIYQERCCAFIDFLGFKSFIFEKDPDVIYKILQKITDAVNGGVNHVFNDLKFQLFSDNIFITAPKSQEGIKDLIEQVFQLTLTALENGAFVRGGITIGDVSQNDKNNIVFGPALIKAYELESQIAKYPRVIFSKSAINYINSENIENFKSQRLRQADDGAWFVDIFNDKADEYYENWKAEFKPIIENALSNNIDNPRVFEKIRWLAEYYNAKLYDDVGSLRGIYEKSVDGVDIDLDTIKLPGWK